MAEIAELGIAIDSSQAAAGIRRIEDRLDRMADNTEKSVRRASSAFGRLRESLFSVRTLIGTLGAGFVLRDAIRTVIGFESAVSNLSAITGATGDDLKFLADAAREMGAATTLSASQAAEAFKLVASAKPDLLDNAEALKEVTQNAVTLAEAASITLPDSARILGSALNQFGADANQAGEFINIMAEGARLGASEITQTAEAMKFAGVIASSMNITFAETNSLIQQLAKVSIKGGEAGTGLRNVLLRLETSTNKRLKPSVVGITQALRNLRDMQLSTDQLNDMFGQRAVVVAQQLINEVDSIEEMAEALQGTNTAFVQAEANFDNLDGDLKRMGSSLEELKLSIFGNTDTLRGFIQSLTKFVVVVTDNLEPIGKLLKILLAFAAAKFLGPLINSIGVSFVNAGKGAALFATRLTFAQQRASVLRATLLGLRGLMAFLGGPGGLILLGATALFSFRDSASEAGRSVDDLNRRLLELQGNQKQLQINAAKEELKELTEQYNELAESLSEAALRMNQLREGNDVSMLSVAESRFKKISEEALALVNVMDALKKKIAELEAPKPKEVVPVTTPDQEGGGERFDPEKELELSQERNRAIFEARLATLSNIERLDIEFQRRRLELENITAEGSIEQAVAAEQALIDLRAKFIADRELMELQHQARLGDLEAQGTLRRRKFEELNTRQKSRFVLSELVSLTQGVAQYNRTAFEANKAASIANAVIKTYEGANQALAAYPPPLSYAMAAAVVAAGFANVNAIKSQSFNGGGAGVSPSFSTSGGVPVTQTQPGGFGVVNQQQQQITEVSVNLGDDDELITKGAVRKLIRRINEELGDGVRLNV